MHARVFFSFFLLDPWHVSKQYHILVSHVSTCALFPHDRKVYGFKNKASLQLIEEVLMSRSRIKI